MDERQFYNERPETKNLSLVCPHCRQEGSYPIRWVVRIKKKDLPRGAGEEDRKRFATARSYMVRVDELVASRETLFTRVVEWQRSVRHGDTEAPVRDS